MLITTAAQKIIDTAAKWVTPAPGEFCKEVTENRGECIDTISKAFDGRTVSEAYCAKFAWVVVEEAVGKDNNKLPHSAGAKNMLDTAKKEKLMTIDKAPKPGSTFYRVSTAKGSSGHIGIVVWGDDKYFYTIEGNTSIPFLGKNIEGVGSHYYPYTDIGKRGFYFIHTEELLGTDTVDANYNIKPGDLITPQNLGIPMTAANVSVASIAVVALVVGAYFVFKKKK
jgi:hypothetical protein